jgi:signal transduction histidine kinase
MTVQGNLLEILFDRMPMGIAILDREYRVQRYNPTWDEYSALYAPPSAAPLAPGVSYFDHLPHTESVVKPLFDRVLAGETVHESSVRLESYGIVTYWDVVLAPVAEGEKITGILVVSIDVSERARLRQNLEERVAARTGELQTLLEVSAAASSSLNLDEMLTKTLDLLVGLVGASRAGVGLVGEESGTWKSILLRPERDIEPAAMTQMLRAAQAVINSGEMMVITPDAAFGLGEPGVLLPLQIRERKLGVLAIIGREGNIFTQGQLELFKSIADQLNIAIENAYLFERAEEVAVAAERNRLARELHDAVTQTLFSASLIAEVLPRIWERDQDEGAERLAELRDLTRGALAEMRTLLLELRPATLTETSLAELLRQLVQAIGGRTRVPIELVVRGTRPLPPKTQVALYRIAQEALNNIIKHAAAERIMLELTLLPEAVLLSIRDDGRGFDPADIAPHSLGVSIMRDRAEKIGAQWAIHSQIGEGTIVTVHCPLADGMGGADA